MNEAVYPELKMRVQYGYDLAGRMNSLSYPGGETVRYERDRAGRVTAVVDSVAGRTEMGYDLLGRQINQRWPNGLSETRTYDSASRLLAITPGQQDKKGAPTITYTYDQQGNRLTMGRSDIGLSTYSYDEISQLLTAALPEGDFQTYTFDAVGNRLSLKDSRGLQTYEYDEADELLEVESDFNPEQPSMVGPLMTRLGASDANKPLFKTTYGWDADGNQVSKTGPGKKVDSYTFDALDRLVGISAPGSEPERYLYNADRQRIAAVRGKDAGGTVAVAERFLHLGRGRQVLADLDGNGKLTKRYVLMPSGQLLARVDSSANKPAFYHFDALGSTVVMSDSANRITTRYFYGPYGDVGETSGIHANGYEFIGGYGIEELADGLLEMGDRQYGIIEGRFISRDPVEGAIGLRWNAYAYVGNNPVNYIDPTGNFNWREAVVQACHVGPFDAIQAGLINGPLATRAVEVQYGQHTVGEGNAMLHCLWSCLNAKTIGDEDARKVGQLHESYSDTSAKDAHNNERGIEAAHESGTCADACAAKRNKGELRITPGASK